MKVRWLVSVLGFRAAMAYLPQWPRTKVITEPLLNMQAMHAGESKPGLGGQKAM